MPDYELAYKTVDELVEDSSAPAAGDWIEVFCDGVNWCVSGQVAIAAGVYVHDLK
ncbi:MAG: hypothetical protein ABGX63_02020 [bacterium]